MSMDNLLIEKEYNDIEYIGLCKKFNTKPLYTKVDLNFEDKDFFSRMKDLVTSDRRGEVVFCVIRPNGKIITTTCESYPKNIYRIPTGGLGYGEDIIKAVFREVKEELGLDVEIIKFGGLIKINFIYCEDSFIFNSYIFILKEIRGRLLLDSLDDEISDIKEATVEELEIIVEKLKQIKSRWKDWGRFRYITSKKIVELLKC